jgi:DNA polymerase-3 subunit delta'
MAPEAVRGQAAALELLARAVASGRVAHAYAFLGPSGVGRKLTAMAFTEALLCRGERQGAGDGARLGGCGRCAACRKVERGVHPDLMVIQPTPPRDNPRGNPAIRLDTIRELERWAALRPVEGPWKVFIIDDAERVAADTAEAFLKTLEEPPARTVIILILTQALALPATVISRCQVVRFVPLGSAEAALVLEARGMDAPTARLLARVCQGRVGLALAQDPRAWVEQRERALSVLAEVGAGGVASLFTWAESLGRDRSQVEQLVDVWWLWYRDLLCAKAGGDPRLVIHGDRQAELAAAAAARSWEEILGGLEACREAWLALRGNVSPRLTLEVTLSRLALRAA